MDWKEQIAEAMDAICGTNKFAVQGDCKLPDPGLVVNAVGPITLPLRAAQVRKLIAVADKAPFGKGTQTVVDTDVRRCWELDPERFQLTGSGWPAMEKILAGGVAFEFGFDTPLFDASLYKLLIYEKGSFFLPHQDGEKNDGMVATLVVTLPGSFSGGELVIEHQGQTLICPSEGAAAGKSASYAAFYADCRHEVRKLEAGYRVCLVYNLSVNRERAREANVPRELGATTQARASHQLIELFGRWEGAQEQSPLVALPLEHQYSPAGLSLKTLKGNDRPRVAAIAMAAEAHDLIAHVCLLNWHQHGTGSYADGRWPTRDPYFYEGPWGDEATDGIEDMDATLDWSQPEKPSPYEMEEVYEESRTMDHWLDVATGRQVGLGSISISQESIAEDDADVLGWRRTKENFEGYTGNAGMTLDRWYSRAAVVVWPRSEHYRILVEAGTQASLGGLQEMVAAARARRGKRRQKELAECAAFAREIIAHWEGPSRFSYSWGERVDEESGTDPLTLLAQIEDAAIVDSFLRSVAVEDDRVDLTGYPEVGRRFGWNAHADALHQVFQSDQPKSLSRNLDAMLAIAEDHDRSSEKQQLTARLTRTWLTALTQYDTQPEKSSWPLRGSKRRDILVGMVKACMLTEQHNTLAKFLRHSVELEEKYALREDHVAAVCELQAFLKSQADLSPLSAWLKKLRLQLEARTETPPRAPMDFRRDDAVRCGCHDCRRLARFLRDPNAEKIEMPMAKARRQHLHQQIDSQRLDVTHQTRRQGSPHVLVCTKTNASYERDLQMYHADVERLKRVRQVLSWDNRADA